MGLFSSKTKNVDLTWNKLTDINQLNELFAEENNTPVLIFKHSTRCSISSMALNKFESQWDENTPCDIYYLDLLNHRDISNAIAEKSGVEHQSPQAILIVKGKVLYHQSHNGISVPVIEQHLNINKI